MNISNLKSFRDQIHKDLEMQINILSNCENEINSLFAKYNQQTPKPFRSNISILKEKEEKLSSIHMQVYLLCVIKILI